MIQQLRRKFILINMSLVCVVLLVVFGVFCFSSYQDLTSQSREAMRRILTHKDQNMPPRLEMGGGRPNDAFPIYPAFCVLVGADGSVLGVIQENVEVSEELVDIAVDRALAAGQREGVLPDLSLRFLVEESPAGTKIAFADQATEKDSMMRLLVTSLLAGAGALVAFFLISLFLSRWALRPVERAWTQQRQFVADASHELKTPLTVILANMGILLSHRQEPIESQKKWVENTQEEAERMKKLVDDLLFLAKSDAAQHSILHSEINYSDLIWSCLLPFESVAYEQGVAIDSEIASDILVQGDCGQLKQLVVILLDNACKYAGKNGKVTFQLESTPDKAVLKVNNTGISIEPDQLDHIFERFYRADKSRARQIGGYGLGLSIAKQIVDSHKGKITVESNPKCGTTFSVFLPRIHGSAGK